MTSWRTHNRDAVIGSSQTHNDAVENTYRIYEFVQLLKTDLDDIAIESLREQLVSL